MFIIHSRNIGKEDSLYCLTRKNNIALLQWPWKYFFSDVFVFYIFTLILNLMLLFWDLWLFEYYRLFFVCLRRYSNIPNYPLSNSHDKFCVKSINQNVWFLSIAIFTKCTKLKIFWMKFFWTLLLTILAGIICEYKP